MRVIFYLLFFIILQIASLAQAANTNEGKKLYDRHCAMCHGLQGKSTMANAPNFKRGEGLFKSDFDLQAHIKKGKNACPAFTGLLKPQQIFDVIAYLRTFYR